MLRASCLFLVIAVLATLIEGATVKRTFTLDPTYAKPDGQYRMMFTVNGQSPGPVLEANEGDDFEILVVNNLPVDMTIHWHGIFQRGTPHMDGVPGITMWAVAPNGNYTYKFSAPGQSGLHWYHAHFRGYLDDGVKGLIYIHPNPDNDRPFSKIAANDQDLEDLLAAEKEPKSFAVYDWRHVQEDEAITLFTTTGRPTTCVDSVLINGKGRVICPTADYLQDASGGRCDSMPFFQGHLDVRGCLIIPGGPQFNADEISSPYGCTNTTANVEIINVEGKPWTYLNVVNAGGEWSWSLSIDDHDLWVVAADGNYVEPQKVQVLNVAIGQRYGVMVKTDKTDGRDYFIRTAGAGFAQVIAGVGLLRYGVPAAKREVDLAARQAITSDPTAPSFDDPWSDLTVSSLEYNSTVRNNATVYNELAGAPFPASAPPAKSTKTLIFHANQTEVTTFQIASRPLASIQEIQMPVLFDDAANESDPSWLYRVPYGAVVDVIMQNAPNALFPAPAEPPHPIHFHGHTFWVLGKKEHEDWKYDSVDAAVKAGVPLNLKNPPVRDTVLLPQSGWLVIRYIANNPGAWLMHCHISSHLQAGMGVVLFEGSDRLPQIPAKYKTPSYKQRA